MGPLLRVIVFCLVAAAISSTPALAAPPALLNPEDGAHLGSGSASIEVSIAPTYFDRGVSWGWRVVASTSAAIVANPWPFAQLDYLELRRRLDAVRADHAARGTLSSSFYEQDVRRTKDQFFNEGLLRDFTTRPSTFGVGIATITSSSSSTTAPIFLDRPGTWYLAAATATERSIEWSPVSTVIVSAPQTPSPPPPSPPGTAAPTPIGTPTTTPPSTKSSPTACQRAKVLLIKNTIQLRRARQAVKKASARRARIVARAKLKRITRTRSALVALHRRAC